MIFVKKNYATAGRTGRAKYQLCSKYDLPNSLVNSEPFLAVT